MTRAFASGLLSVSALALGACYDWQIGASSTDAAHPDAHTNDAVPAKPDVIATPDAGVDATVTLDATAPSVDATKPDASAPSCPSLASNVSTTEAAAKACTLGSATECTMSVQDTCSCNVFVTSPSSSATTAFTSAVAAFLDAGCVATCTGCLEPGATSGTCLDMETTSGVTTACTP